MGKVEHREKSIPFILEKEKPSQALCLLPAPSGFARDKKRSEGTGSATVREVARWEDDGGAVRAIRTSEENSPSR